MSDFAIEYEPRLVEEAVLRAVASSSEARQFRIGRDTLYTIEDSEQREAGFRNLHAEWFVRLALDRPLRQALAEFSPAGDVQRYVVLSARTRTDEGVELFVAASGAGVPARHGAIRTVVIRVRPELLLDEPNLSALLRDELAHVADMLDPDFGYQPSLALVDGDPSRRRLILDRIRVLWNAKIAGQLARRGQLEHAACEQRLGEFMGTFLMLGEEAAGVFARFFEGKHRWGELVAFAKAPVIAGHGSSPYPANCPLCGSRIASHDVDRPISGAVEALIRKDFAAWRPQDAICAQCAELYRAREKLGRGRECLPGQSSAPAAREG